MDIKKKRRTFTREYKLQAVRLSEVSDQGVAALERELGLSKGQLSHWRSQYLAGGEEAFVGRGKRTPQEQELYELRQEVARLKEERDILKKVLAMYSQDPS